MGLIRTVDATLEPVTLDEAKKQIELPISRSTHDPHIDQLITRARKTAERLTRRAFLTQTWKLTLTRFPYYSTVSVGHASVTGRLIMLPRPPLISVSSVAYIDTASVSQTMTVTDDYVVNVNSHPGNVALAVGSVWPTTEPEAVEAVTVTYVAGYGATRATVPDEAKQAILALVAYWWNNRDKADVPDFVDCLLSDLSCGMTLGAYEVTG